VQPLQQLAVHRAVPGELAEARTTRIVRRVHRRFVDADQAQLGVLVVAVGEAEELRRDGIVVDAELRLVEDDEVLNAVRRWYRLARQQIEDRADRRRGRRKQQRDTENAQAANSQEQLPSSGSRAV
jgi:hypothetical protein